MMTGVEQSQFANLTFKHLPHFATFVREKKIKEFAQLQFKYSHEYQIPMLQFFSSMSEDAVMDLIIKEANLLFDFLSVNDAHGFIEYSISRWQTNQLPVVGKHNIESDDLSLVIYVRKKAFLKLIPDYEKDLLLALELIDELEMFSLQQLSRSFDTYISILNSKVNEHLHFAEKIAKTTPGIIYIFDLISKKEIYTNQKANEILGHKTLRADAAEKGLIQSLMHPNDSNIIDRGIVTYESLNDNDIYSTNFRLKTADDSYKWMRCYETIFKRTDEGKPWQIIGIAIDVDEEKKANEQLQNREEELLEAQEMARLGSFTYNTKDATATTSPELLKILNIEQHTPARSVLAQVNDSDRDKLKKILLTAIENKTSYEYEFKYKRGSEEKVIRLRGKAEIKESSNALVKGTIMDVTDAHKMLQRLRESEKLYIQAEALTHIGNWKWDIEQDIVEWSDELYRIHGLQPGSEAITLKKVNSYVHEDDRDHLNEKIQQCIENGKPYDVYYRLVLKDGTLRYIFGKGEIMSTESGKPTYLFGTAQDITHQYETHELLEENQKYLEKITDAAPFLMVAYNVKDLSYNFVSKASETILGYPQDHLLKEGRLLFKKILHPDDLSIVKQSNVDALRLANDNHAPEQNDFITEFVCRAKHKNGNYKWLHTYATVLDRDSDNKVEHMLHISMDITDKVEAEQTIREQEHLIKHIADASPTILYVYDLAERKVVYVNQEVLAVLEYYS